MIDEKQKCVINSKVNCCFSLSNRECEFRRKNKNEVSGYMYYPKYDKHFCVKAHILRKTQDVKFERIFMMKIEKYKVFWLEQTRKNFKEDLIKGKIKDDIEEKMDLETIKNVYLYYGYDKREK